MLCGGDYLTATHKLYTAKVATHICQGNGRIRHGNQEENNLEMYNVSSSNLNSY